VATPTTKQWTEWLDAARRQRRELVDSHWSVNVNFRMMKPFGAHGADDSPAQDTVAVPEDWARTRQKTAQLAARVPKIVARAKRPEFESAAPVVTAAVNEYLNRCQFSYTLDENLADVINAAGIMACMVGVDIRTKTVEVEVPRPPVGLDPLTGEPIPDPEGPEMQSVEQVVFKGFTIDRISPGALLRPCEFTGSNWRKAPWLAYESWVSLADARRRYPKIPKDFKGSTSKPVLLSKDVQTAPSRVSDEGEVDTLTDGERYAKITTVWYRTACYDEAEVHPDALSTLVFVDGVPDPVESGPTDWQTWVDETPAQAGAPGPDGQPQMTPPMPGHYLGLKTFPIVIGTLTYVSDVATPPSDSQAARPQVREMIRSRSQMIRQRDHSVPVRWYDVNRLDEITVSRLQNGEWLDMIPVNGPGDRIIGEVARASYPRESFQFAQVIKSDLDQTWAMSNTQLGTMNDTERSASEVNVVANAAGTRADYEKDRVSRYVAEVAEVLFSLMQRFLDDTDYVQVVGPDGVERLQPISASTIAGDYALEFKTDSSDRVDITTRQNSLLKLYNLAANSPSLNRMAIEKELIESFGQDPAKFQTQPTEKGPEPPNISYRFSGEDMMNPIAVALMLKSGHDVGQDAIRAAQMLIRDAIVGMQQLAQQPQMTPTAGGPSGAPPPGAVPPGQQPPDVEPPAVNEPILKRAADGSRLT
jgi:hypothetical protein